jgi:hypothetical protein
MGNVIRERIIILVQWKKQWKKQGYEILKKI